MSIDTLMCQPVSSSPLSWGTGLRYSLILQINPQISPRTVLTPEPQLAFMVPLAGGGTPLVSPSTEQQGTSPTLLQGPFLTPGGGRVTMPKVDK